MDDNVDDILRGFEHAPVGLEVLRQEDPQDRGSFRLVAVNAAACKILQQDMTTDIGKTWNETSPDLVESSFPDLFIQALRTREPVSWEVEYGDTRFEENWWRGTATPIDERTVVIVFQNVSSEKENLMELERSNRALDDFAYVASHDLKAPLRDIDNLSSWIVADLEDVPEETAAHVAKMRQRVQRMEKLLDDLLEYSRAGRVYARPEAFSLRDALRSAADLAPAREGFRVVLPAVDVPMFAPRPPFELVVRNLIANALKHHDGDSGLVTVAVRDQDGRIEVSVTDDGPGIDAAFHERVFALFQTLRPRDEVEGSGLGLALCRKLVEAYGESLTVRSAPGEGATFTFTWPSRWSERGD